MKNFKLTITIPVTDLMDWTIAVEECQARFLETCGGYTMHEAKGAWRNPLGETEYEPVMVISSLTKDYAQQETVWPFMRNMARMVKRFLKQEEVLIQIEDAGKVVFV